MLRICRRVLSLCLSEMRHSENNNEIIISPGDHVAALTVLFSLGVCLFLLIFLDIHTRLVQKINAIVLHFACLFPRVDLFSACIFIADCAAPEC